MRIVVVEDDPDTRSAIVECLGEAGMAVAQAGSGEGFLALLSPAQGEVAQGEVARADVLMVDLNLGGGMTGFDVAHLARTRWPEVTVVYITGDLRAVVKTSSARDLCLLKPFTEAALLQLVRSVGGI